MEIRTAVHDGLCVLCHAAAEHLVGDVVCKADGVEIAGAEAPAAADAMLGHGHLAALLVKDEPAVGALLLAFAAASAEDRVNLRLSGAVLVLLAGAGAAAHAYILDGSAESGLFMPLEMAEADEDVRVHHRAPDMGFLDILSSAYGDVDVIRTLETVRYDDRASDSKRGESVLPGAIEMLQSVFPEAGVHGVAVGKERLAAKFLDDIHDCLCEIRTQEADVAQLPEMHLDGDELAVKIDVSDTCGTDQAL